MLRSLSIKNYILIDDLDFDPDQNLTVISGETGTGKSMLLGALGLVLGNRADAKALLDPGQKCTVEATFDLPNKKFEVFFLERDLDFDQECIIRREILSSGKSRAFINDTPVTLDVLRALGSGLVDIHSQHDILRINDEDFQIGILDILGENNSLLEEYKDSYYKLESLKAELNKLKEDLSKAESEFDFNKFQLDELSALNIVEGEEEDLEQALKKGENLESVKNSISRALQLLQNPEMSLADLLYELKSAIDVSSNYSQNFEQVSSRIESIIHELRDIESSLEDENQSLETDPQKLHELRNRYDEIYRLMKKHKSQNTGELIQAKEELEKKTNIILQGDEELKEKSRRIEVEEQKAQALANKISENRKAAGIKLENDILTYLSALGMLSGVLNIRFEEGELNQYGMDRITFLFSANKGLAPKPVKETASGGEMSRLMLIFKYLIGGKSEFPTMIFDEIDTGVSGEIALQMGKMIAEIAQQHQIVCITHLPQVAASGEKHFKVEKEESGKRTQTLITEVRGSERIEEIAEMIGGKDHSENVLQSAKELLNKRS